MAKLSCVRGNNKGDEFPVHEGKNTVGRAQDCHIVLFDKKCSHQHFKLYKCGNRYSICDLESRNGTLLNGKFISASFKPCKVGDLIQAGETMLLLSDKPIGNIVDRTATDVVEELQNKNFEKVLDKAYHSLPDNKHPHDSPKGLRRLIHKIFS
ncbi:MAG: FHA domain-containing protein [Lentisphaeria bacterium]